MFSPAQLLEIKSANLARVICDNGDDIREIPQDVFLKSSYPEEYVSCDNDAAVPAMDVKVWASCCHGE